MKKTSTNPIATGNMIPMLEKQIEDTSICVFCSKLGVYATVWTTKALCEMSQCSRPEKIMRASEYRYMAAKGSSKSVVCPEVLKVKVFRALR